jgi:hypothetical protein
MELGTYINKDGHLLNVVEIDSEGKRVRVDYGGGHFHWWGEEDYGTWTPDLAKEAVEKPKKVTKKTTNKK